MNPGRVILSLAATAVCLAVIAWTSGTHVGSSLGEGARLRLSWSARPERIERCRELSQEELAARGEHMRQRFECEGVFASYELEVSVDGREVHRSVARGAGLRHDRPIFLLEEIEIPPGPHRIEVDFERRENHEADDAGDREHDREDLADTGISVVREDRERVERARRARAAIPRELSMDTTLHFDRGRVLIVTLDPETRRLVLLGPSPD